MAPMDLTKLQTEARNPRSTHIDELSALEICEVINREDATVAATVTRCLPVIAGAVDALTERVRNGGRVVYVGAGTSGRLGVLDASEIPPTYSAPSDQFVGLIAGGDAAIRHAQEGAEDSKDAAKADLSALNLVAERDALIGIAASGQTPYVLACLAYAKRIGCVTVGVACSSPSQMEQSGLVDYMITAVTGPEVVTGSTRMKAGTATKLVLNTLSTALMIRVGKTFGNMMVDLKPSNEKLKQRSRNIIRSLSGTRAPPTDQAIDNLLVQTAGSVKLALAVILLETNVEQARLRLDAAGGRLAEAVKKAAPSSALATASQSLRNLVLCIDGGATKCGAAVIDSTGRIGRGLAGPCNVTDYNIPSVTATIVQAASSAIADLTGAELKPSALHSIQFDAVWVGMAGYERAALQPQIQAGLSKLFGLPVGRQLRISADVDLLASGLASQDDHIRSIVTLIAGTGSIAMRYEVRHGEAQRTGRSGGWGHLLGDDGSGFDLGREAVRHTLSQLDSATASRSSKCKPGTLAHAVLVHLGLNARTATNSELVTATMVPAPQGESLLSAQGSSDVRTRIATLGRIVLESAATDADAARIMQRGVEGLMRTLRPLTEHSVVAGAHGLVLGGGLMRHQGYRQSLLDALARTGLQFGTVHVVDDPAEAGAAYLRRREAVVARAKL